MHAFYRSTRSDLEKFWVLKGKKQISEEEIKTLESYKNATPEERESFDGQILGSMSMGLSFKPKVKALTFKSPFASSHGFSVQEPELVDKEPDLRINTIAEIPYKTEEEIITAPIYFKEEESEIDKFIA